MDNKLDILRASAVVHGQHGHHERALQILALELKDYHAALRYCVEHSKTKGPTGKSNREPFHILLNIYFNTENKSHKEEIIKLLNSPLTEFDSLEVLKMIPNEWSVSEISEFFIKSFRASHHEKFSTSVEKGLLLSESERLQLLEAKNAFEEPYLITSATLCDVCSLPFENSVGKSDEDDGYPVENNPFESPSSSPESFPTSSYSSSSIKSQMESDSNDIILIRCHNQLVHARCCQQLDTKYDGNNSCSNSFTLRQ